MYLRPGVSEAWYMRPGVSEAWYMRPGTGWALAIPMYWYWLGPGNTNDTLAMYPGSGPWIWTLVSTLDLDPG